MPEKFSILAELTSAVIGAITGILAEDGKSLGWKKIKEKRLIRKIRKREKYLKRKYEKSFELLNDRGRDSFCEWLEEKRTINRILSFSNAEDVSNISTEQMRYSREYFFTDAFHMAQARDFNEKEELRKVLNDLFLYVDELFWGALDEKDVFLYKKSIGEIRELISKYTGDIIREIQYQGSFAEYIDNQKVMQKVQFKLDYRSEEIPFVGRTEEFGEIDAFCASEKQISWWAVIGKGGSGKSRLVYEYIKNNMGSAEWKMRFLREEFFSQAGGGGKYKTWNTWTYDKNLLLVVDYVQKYAKEVAQWIEGLSNSNSITRKIRILLLERTDGEQSLWMRKGFEKTVVDGLKYDKDFLRMQSLDVDLILFAIKYAEKNGKQISKADAEDAWDKLKSIDADTRILYFIMILEAVFDNEPWRSWNRNDLAGYIVRREQEDIEIRFKHNKDVVRSFNRVLAFCTATKELPVFELPENLPEMIKKEIEVIKNNSGDKRELCAEMQLENGVLQPVTPDIIGEYMVLYIIDQYFFDKEEKGQFIRELWTYDSGDFEFFIYRLFQDKMDDGSYKGITKLMLFDAVQLDNIGAVENYSNLLVRMTNISYLKRALVLVEKLEKIYRDYSSDEIMACSYAKGLANLCHKQKEPGIKETVKELARVAKANEGNRDIQSEYAYGLLNLSGKQELPEIIETVKELERLHKANEQNVYIYVVYARGVLNMLLKQEKPEVKEVVMELAKLAKENEWNEYQQEVYAYGLCNLSSKQELPELKETVKELARVAEANEGNGDIQSEYVNGLLKLSYEQEQMESIETVKELARVVKANEGREDIQIAYAHCLCNLSSKQEEPKLKEIVRELARVAKANEGNEDIQTVYAKGLFNLSIKQEVPELKETVGELSRLSEANEGNEDIQTVYAKGLFSLSIKQEVPELKETVEELSRLSEGNEGNGVIQTVYACSLVDLSIKQEVPELKETVEELSRLSEGNKGNGDIQTVYAKGLFNLSIKQELPERKETVGELARLAAENRENAEIQTIYTEIMDIFGSD